MTHTTLGHTLRWAFGGPEGGSGRVVVAWVLAGGATGGGVLAGVLILAGRSTPGLLVLLGPILFVAGSLLGAVHGVALAVAGRPRGVTRGEALRRAALGAAVSIPLLTISWITSAAITVGSATQMSFRVAWLVVGIIGWAFGLLLLAWAVREGWQQARRAWARFRRRHLGLMLTVLVAGLGTVFFEQVGPAVAGGGRYPGLLLSLPLSVALTLWLWVPFLYVLLRGGRGAEGMAADPGLS